MHKFFLVLVMILCGLMVMACGFSINVQPSRQVKETRPVSNVNAVVLTTSGDLQIVSGEKESLEIEAGEDMLRHLTSEVVDGRLVLGWKSGMPVKIEGLQPIRYRLTVKSIDTIEATGSGDAGVDVLSGEKITIGGKGSGNVEVAEVKGEVLDLLISGSGNVSIKRGTIPSQSKFELHGSGSLEVGNLETADLNVIMDGSGDLTVSQGRADRLQMTAGGSGRANLEGLALQVAQVDTRGSGDVRLWVSGKLDTVLNGSGEVSYYGEPVLTFSQSGSGEVVALGKKE